MGLFTTWRGHAKRTNAAPEGIRWQTELTARALRLAVDHGAFWATLLLGPGSPLALIDQQVRAYGVYLPDAGRIALMDGNPSSDGAVGGTQADALRSATNSKQRCMAAFGKPKSVPSEVLCKWRGCYENTTETD